MGLIKKIEAWQKEGLISQLQVSAIIDFENKTKKPALLYMFLFLSVFCIGVGVVSVIAANWYDISANIKLAIDFAILILVAGGIYWSDSNKKLFSKEALILLYSILIIATIGLVAQIYHLKSDGYSAILFWSIMTAPMLILTRKSILPFIWIPMFYYSFNRWVLNNFEDFVELIAKVFQYNGAVLSAYLLTFLVLSVSFASDRYKEKISYIIKPMGLWIITLLVWDACIVDFGLNWVYHYRYSLSETIKISPYFYFFTSILVALLAWCVIKYKKKRISYLYYAIIILLAFSFLGYSKFIGAMSSFSMLGLLMLYAYKQNAGRLFNFAGALVALRIFIIYIQVFGSLLSTGIGLIVSGLVLLGIVLAWYKIGVTVKLKIKENVNEA